MTQERKSSATTQKVAENKKAKVELISILNALDLMQIRGTKRFAALKLFKKQDPKSEKDWRKLFSERRIA